jgi:ATP-dependent RNA helicase RhlE
LTFHDFSFDPELVQSLDSMGIKQPTEIQAKAIPIILQGHDIVGCAQTGTGKTAAYLLPIMQMSLKLDHRHLNTLILAPTRELAQQIDQQVQGLGYFLNVSSISVYGGGDGAVWDQQRKALEEGADIAIATPGRLLALLATGTVNFEHLEHLVLDEADRMLDMGFFDDIMKIIAYLPKDRQTLLFSATMPPKIRTLANKILKDPKEVTISIAKPAAGIKQRAFVLHDHQKLPLLIKILKKEEFTSVIVFCSRKESVKLLHSKLKSTGFDCEAFSSDLEQPEREAIMTRFKNKLLRILVGTDVLSRGIDVEGISLVVNFDAPPDPEDYVHRVGRTARAETTGTAITFINERDQRSFHEIENLIGYEVQKVPMPPDLGEAPLYEPLKKRAGLERKPSSSSHRRDKSHGSGRGSKPFGARR